MFSAYSPIATGSRTSRGISSGQEETPAQQQIAQQFEHLDGEARIFAGMPMDRSGVKKRHHRSEPDRGLELKKREFEYATTTPPRPPEPSPLENPEPAEDREAVFALPLFGQEKPSAQSAGNQDEKPAGAPRIAIGDTVRVKYLTDDRKILHITISRSKSDPSQGIIHYETPVAQALLGAEEGDEVEVLIGSYVRPAVVERIIKAAV
jgi:hypothetical protein